MAHITRTHGFKHMQGNPEYREEEKKCHLCQVRNFDVSKAGFIIAITNDVDDEWIEPDFRFIENCEYGKGVQKAAEGFSSGCECTSNIDCALEECACLEDLDPENIINPQYRNAYYTAGPRKGLLREELLETSSDEIYECSDLCMCSKDCPNRIVGRGREFNIEIFRTNDGRGWGTSYLHCFFAAY
jgi:histone-lysine N-methyltransferase SUV39H